VVARLKYIDPTRRRFDEFAGRISRLAPKGSLQFHHLLLPHSPWRYLPSGVQYGNAATIDGILDSWNEWSRNPRFTEQGYQRHLLQLGYVDRLLGTFLDSLQVSGSFDRALVVVAADHGVSFKAGGTRRTVSAENVADIARIPLFVKLPNQEDGRVDSRAVQTVDVLPTVADALGIALPFKVDGRSLLQDRPRAGQVVVQRRDGSVLRAEPNDVDRAFRQTLRTKDRLFGQGRDSLYRLGLNQSLLGQPVGVNGAPTSGRVALDGDSLYEDVQTGGPFRPTRITGTITGLDISADRELAVAVNGRVVALAGVWLVSGRQRFSAMAPATAFVEGSNRVEVYVVEREHGRIRLHSLRRTAKSRFTLDLSDRTIEGPSGERIQIRKGRLAGAIESWRLDAGIVRLRGWAADLRDKRLVDGVLVFSEGSLVYAGETSEFRWDLDATQRIGALQRSGWLVEVPATLLQRGDVRIFAHRGGAASQLQPPRDFPFD
jgi:hypothetical protein